MKEIIEGLFDYPEGAIKSTEEITCGIFAKHEPDIIVYFVEGCHYSINRYSVREPIFEKLFVRHPYICRDEKGREHLYVAPILIPVSMCNIGFLRNSHTNAFLFSNYWMAQAYFIRLKEMFERDKKQKACW